MAAVGKRTSIYLSDDLATAVAESGVPLAELIRRGLGVADQPGGTKLIGSEKPISPITPFARAEPGSARPAARRRCPHPGTRVIGGWCRQCGVVVEPGGFLPG